jgi:hypothetical protein
VFPACQRVKDHQVDGVTRAGCHPKAATDTAVATSSGQFENTLTRLGRAKMIWP